MKAILIKELKSYFLSPLGYMFVGIFIFINAMFFVNNQLAVGVANVKYLFADFNFFFMFIVAILTMRLLSEEKNKKTDQLLITAPVNVTEIVLGKYLAAFCVFLLSLIVSFVFPITLFIFGNPPLGQCIGGYIGFILLWGALISVGVLISALTENQMIAAVFTFVAMLVIYYIDAIAGSIPNPILSKIVGSLTLFGRYNDFSSGLLNFANIIYFLSFIFVFLFLTVKVIEKRRYS